MTLPRDADRADERLAVAAREGDVRAFEALLERHETRVFRVLRLMGVPLQDREDVAQDVLLRVFRHLDGFRKGRPFRSWLYKIAVNAAHDYRARKRRSSGETSWEGKDPDTADPNAATEAGVERRELARRLEFALRELTDRERAVFILREMEGLPTVDVARTLGISRITVRRHLGLARQRLRALLQSGSSGRT